jgi:inner membrane protein
MDNLTHSLLGGALAHLALPRGADPPARRVFFAVGIVAANLPDIDLLFTGITPRPLGYLLHHRGHTHTLVGLLVGALLLAGVAWLVPTVRRLASPERRRLALLGAVALGSHLVLDSWNSYGVHPFYPFDRRWLYGDAVFIFEPWLWLLLGVALAANASGRWARILVSGLVVLPIVALTIRWAAPPSTGCVGGWRRRRESQPRWAPARCWSSTCSCWPRSCAAGCASCCARRSKASWWT